MKTFQDLKFKTHAVIPGGKMAKLLFPNGYGVSVVAGPHLYGNGTTTFEVAVLKQDSEGRDGLCYDTPVTDDVLGWQTKEEVTKVMEQVQLLPKVEVLKV
jgi:hypothetical protein